MREDAWLSGAKFECVRITKEQSLLKEKLLLMEVCFQSFKEREASALQAHLQRKSLESQRKAGAFERAAQTVSEVALQERLVRKGAQCSQALAKGSVLWRHRTWTSWNRTWSTSEWCEKTRWPR